MTLFESLPGLETPVAEATQRLAAIWEGSGGSGGAAPSAFRASQMNVLLHLGFATTAADARTRFETLLRFSRKHPCRGVVLCPVPPAAGEVALRAKLYAECHIGSSRAEMVCSEAIILSYAWETRDFLENQVSTLIESDLPFFYWPNQFQLGRRLADYGCFTGRAQRVVFDSALEAEDLAEHAVGREDSVRDLAHARLLPVRQSLGQFLSAFTPAQISLGLRSVCVRADASQAAEGRALLRWLEGRLAACALEAGALAGTPVGGHLEPAPAGRLEVALGYASGQGVHWSADLHAGCGRARADLGGRSVEMPITAGLLLPEAALAEALFFD